jgi:hypothetical protein
MIIRKRVKNRNLNLPAFSAGNNAVKQIIEINAAAGITVTPAEI